jgi:hypothetical protein
LWIAWRKCRYFRAEATRPLRKNKPAGLSSAAGEFFKETKQR